MDTDTRHCHQAKKNPLSANLQNPNRSGGGGVRSSTSNFCFNVLILRKKCLLQEKVAPPPNATCLHKTLIHMFWPLWLDTNTHMNTIWYLKIKRKWCKALYILFIIVITTAFWSTLLALIYILLFHAFALWSYRSWYYSVVFIWVHALTQTVSLTIHKIKLLKGGICRYTNYCACTIYMYQVNFCSICHCTSKYLHAMLSFYVTICLIPYGVADILWGKVTSNLQHIQCSQNQWQLVTNPLLQIMASVIGQNVNTWYSLSLCVIPWCILMQDTRDWNVLHSLIIRTTSAPTLCTCTQYVTDWTQTTFEI